MITRHILTVHSCDGAPARKVHYRRCGSGPALLMVHQSPRSSAEFEELMRKWSAHFTCIAPDTPGFGQSDPLPGEPEIEHFADALAGFVQSLGLGPCAAYGFHSGAVIIATAARLRPELFSAMVLGGYAIWNEAEYQLFGAHYLPEWHPTDYGEHLTWLWNRMLEQSWFFPWFDIRDETRLPGAHADLERLGQAISEMLDAGNNYRTGYGAVLRAPRDIPDNSGGPPCLISAFDGDPLQSHIDRLGKLPPNWRAEKVSSPQDHENICLAFLKELAGSSDCPALAQDKDEGWLEIDGGLIHWRGQRGSATLALHDPAAEMDKVTAGTLAIDAPGHGRSSDFPDMERVISKAADMLGAARIDWPKAPAGDPNLLYPDLAPDAFGSYLNRAWSAARAQAMFTPWYAPAAANAIPVDAEALVPANIAKRAYARLRAGTAALQFHTLLKLKGQKA